MHIYNIQLLGNPTTKKNGMQRTKTGVIYNKKWYNYKNNTLMIGNIPDKPINYAVNIRMVFYRETKHRVDLDGLICACLDVIKGKVIEDDNCTIAWSFDGSRAVLGVGKGNGKTEIEITEVIV